ncbi:hypothetical protein Q7P35_001951 [Cladosporium inversicolor]
MPPADPPVEILLRVKVPPGHIEGSSADEFSLGTVSTTIPIGEIRQQIQHVLPSHPNPYRQRLLYAGRALVDNDQTLATALNTRRDTSQNEYVLHLLVKGEQDGVGGPGIPARRAVTNPGTSGGLLNAGQPQDHGNVVRLVGQPGDALPQGQPQGLPQGLPQGAAHHHNLQAQMMALRMQQQAQLQQLHAARHQAGMPPAHLPNPLQFAPGQPPLRHGPRPGDHPASDQSSAQRPAGDGEGAGPNASQQDGANEQGAQPTHPNLAPAPHPQQAQGLHRPISGQGFHVQGVGPNGNRFEIHQQTLNIPFPGQQAQFGMPMPGGGMGLPFPLPGMAQQPRLPNPAQQVNGPSALDRARQNVAEMRQMVEAMRNTNATEEDRARTARLQEHIQAVNDYIDPFGVGRATPAPRSTSPFPARMAQSMRSSPSLGLGPFAPPPRTQPTPLVPNMNCSRQQPPSGSDTTCYLLSSPQGPQALLFSPQHGTYTGSLAGHATTGLSSGVNQYNGLHRVVHLGGASGHPALTPTQPAGAAHNANGQAGNAPVDPAVAAAQQIAQQINQAQQAQARADNPGGPLQPLLAHFWLLLRVMIFAYFIIGTNMGWRRPVALATIGLGFYLIRAGLFGDGGIARRWWDGIVRVEQRPRAQAQAQGEAAPADGEQRPGQLPTPEELAQRLIQERQEALNRAPLHRIREQLRPVERAGALFFASLWPGVGEAHVRAREAEERRLQEEEVEQRRREEEERQRAIEAAEGEKTEGEKKGEGSADAVTEGDEKPAAEKEVSATSPEDIKEFGSSEGPAQEATEQAAQ